MHLTKKQWGIVGIGIASIAVISVGVWQYRSTKTSAPTTGYVPTESPATTAGSTTSTSTEAQTPTPHVTAFPINPVDTIASWSFKGAYTGNDTLIAQANADISKLTNLLGKDQYDDYDVYLGIGNDDNFLGDGAGAYQNYNRAISIHPDKGLAYANLGHLMGELGAYRTAADAYAEAVAVEPSVPQYKNAQLDFLTWRFPEEAARLKTK